MADEPKIEYQDTSSPIEELQKRIEDVELSLGVFNPRNMAGMKPGDLTVTGLVVGTNVGLGTAQTSAQVTTIVGNTVTTGYVNALSVLAGSVAAENITGTTITGKTVRTSSGTTRVEMHSTDNEMVIYKNGYETVVLGDGAILFNTPTGVASGGMYGVGTNQVAIGISSNAYYFNDSAMFPSSSNTLTCGTSSYRWSNIYSTLGNFNGTITSKKIAPVSNGSYPLGDASYRWLGIWSGTGNFKGIVKPSTTNTYNLGASGYNWSYLYVNYCATNIRPTSTSLNLGDSSYYWNEINYKTLTKRGGFGFLDNGVELQDGKIVSDVEAIVQFTENPNKKTPYGTSIINQATLPKIVYRPATDNDGKLLARDKNNQPYQYVVDDKTKKSKKVMAEDGEDVNAMISIIIGSIKELDYKNKLLEQEIKLLKNK